MSFAQITTSDGQVSGVDDLSTAASSVINWETDDAGVNRPRPGLAAYSVTDLGATAVNGLDRWLQYMVVTTTDGSVYAVHEDSPTQAIVLSHDNIPPTTLGNTLSVRSHLSGGKRPTFVEGEEAIYITAGDLIHYWQPGNNISVGGGVHVVSLNYWGSGPRCTHIAGIGQRMVANDIDEPNSFRWSELGEGEWTSWPADNSSDPDARPDPVSGVFENANQLFVFGSSSLQIYQVGTDPNNPFDLVSALNTGLLAPYCIVRVDDDFYYLDDKLRIVNTNGRGQSPVSDAIQRDLRNLSVVEDSWAYRLEQGQKSQLGFVFPTDKRCFMFDLKNQAWHEQDYYANGMQSGYPAGGFAYWPALNKHFVGSSLSAGGLYTLDATSRQDIGGALVCERTTGWHDHGSKNRKRGGRIRITMRRGTAADSTPASGALEVRVQDDDKPWSPWRSIPIGGPGDFKSRIDVWTAGIFTRRRYGFRFSTTEDISLVEAFDDITELAA